jgi:hypothetical protein
MRPGRSPATIVLGLVVLAWHPTQNDLHADEPVLFAQLVSAAPAELRAGIDPASRPASSLR